MERLKNGKNGNKQTVYLFNTMHEFITRLHRLKRIEEEFLRRMQDDKEGRPAYERTAQEFFSRVALEQEEETNKSYQKGRPSFRTRITMKEEKKIAEEFMMMKQTRWAHRKFANKHNITIQQLTRIIKKFSLQKTL